MFPQLLVQAQIKENIKAPRHWPLWGEFTGDRWSSLTKGQQRGKCFNFMTSSWHYMQRWRPPRWVSITAFNPVPIPRSTSIITLPWRHICIRVSQTTDNFTVCLTVCPGTHQTKHIKDPRLWPLWGESIGDVCIPLTKGKLRGKCFHLKTSSWCFGVGLLSNRYHDMGRMPINVRFWNQVWNTNKFVIGQDCWRTGYTAVLSIFYLQISTLPCNPYLLSYGFFFFYKKDVRPYYIHM